MSKWLAGPVLAGLLFVALPGIAAGQDSDGAIDSAVAFIIGTQQADGGFGGFGPGQTMDAIYAIRAAGVDPAAVETGGVSTTDFLEANAAGADTPAAAGKAALAAVALGLDPSDVAGTDFHAVIEAGFDETTGEYAGDAFTHSIAVLGLVCTGGDAEPLATEALRTSQLDDGGWGFEGASDPDTTAIALQALIALGVDTDDEAVAAAIDYFQTTQASDGGWGFSPTESNAASTAFAIQALIAAGEPVNSAAFEKGGVSPAEYLLSQQQDDGSFIGFDPAFAAMQVVPALAGRTYCDAPSTPITSTPPTPTATATTTVTATITATATSTPTMPPTTAPKPPNTGSGTADTNSTPWLALGGAVALLAAGAAATARRRR